MHSSAPDPSPAIVLLDSSSLRSVGYSTEAGTLDVAFRSGSVYRYFGVPLLVYQALLDASSKGRYFVHSIRSSYRFERLQ